MQRQLKMIVCFTCSLLFIISCVTININFPAAEVEKAADEIVEETWGNKGEPQSLLNRWLRIASLKIGPKEANAQQPNINVTTPAIRSLKGSMKKRANAIKPYLGKGNVGLTNDGLLTVRSTKGLNLKDKAKLTRLIKAENKDRNALYLEIAKANNFGPEMVSDIKVIFSKSWFKNAKAGWWVQDPKGGWSRK